MAKTRHSSTIPSPASNDNGAPMQHICRTCLEEIQVSSLIPLNDSLSNIRNELRTCIPEVDFDLVPNAGICTYCLNTLHVAYEFKLKCLQTEEKIRKQLHRKLLVDLTKLKKTNNFVQVEADLGMDVVYINDISEYGEVESPHPISTPLLDEEITRINESAHDTSDVDSQCRDDLEDALNTKTVEPYLILGLCESAPRKPTTEIATTEIITRSSSRMQTPSPLPTHPFPCVFCKEAFDQRKPYIEHLKLTHPRKFYNCTTCKFKVRGLVSFIEHTTICRLRKAVKYKCTTCKFVTPVKMLYKKHLRMCLRSLKRAAPPRHLDDGRPKTESPSSFYDLSNLECRFCNFRTKECSTFEAHSHKVHGNAFPYACKDKQCPFIAKHKSNLVHHMMQHYGERPFRCCKCTYQCLRESGLNKHMKKHAGITHVKKWKRAY